MVLIPGCSDCILRMHLPLHFHAGAQHLVDQRVAQAAADGGFLGALLAELGLKDEVQPPVPAFAEVIAEENFCLQDIAADTELTIDFAELLNEEAASFPCRCGSAACRGTIRGTPGNSVTRRIARRQAESGNSI